MDPKDWQQKLKPYTKKSNWIAVSQLLSTILPLVALWALYIVFYSASTWAIIPFSLVISLFLLRSFVLLHDCGHNVLFKSAWANRFFGYLLGVITGMPQYVWSKHHAYHHSTNGDWEKYRGPLGTQSTHHYSQLTPSQKRSYWAFRHPAILIIGGFYYILFNPRFTWMMGTLKVSFNIFLSLNPFSNTKTLEVIKRWESKYWKTPKEYRHMTYNNLTLLGLWAAMIYFFGAATFFPLYILSLSLAGSLGILFFTVQHNFEGSYATDSARVDHYKAALQGSSYLKLPGWLTWFTADISYHHIHHLSTAIPNYRLAQCHQSFGDLFAEVKRLYLSDLLKSFKYQLWDPKKEMIVSREDFQG